MLDCWTEAETPGLKEIFDVEDQALVRRIVAIDETWIRELEPELKSQSNMWRATGSARSNKVHEFNRRSSKWWSLLMITKESSWKRESHVEEVLVECTIVLSCKNFAGKCTRTDLSCSWLGHSFSMAMLARTSPLWVGSVVSCSLQSRHEPARLRLIPKAKLTCAWTTFFFSGSAFYWLIRAIRYMDNSGVLDQGWPTQNTPRDTWDVDNLDRATLH